ncbi:hypothetical protein [Dapis sp. BLCC M172]
MANSTITISSCGQNIESDLDESDLTHRRIMCVEQGQSEKTDERMM